MKIKITKLNESYSILDAPLETLERIHNFLKVERDDAYFDPLVKRGFKSPFDFFTILKDKRLYILNGHLSLLKNFDIEYETQECFKENELKEFLENVKLPFKPYDFQLNAFYKALQKGRCLLKMCTGSGKSLTISLICDFLRQKGLKGLLLVPNINLLTQFKNDIKSYDLDQLFEETDTLGGGHIPDFNKKLLISTWQSMCLQKDKLDYDYVICDECLDPNTIIKTQRGNIKIKDVKVNDKVFCFNEKTNVNEYKEVLEVHKNLFKSLQSKVYKVTFEGRELIITGNHNVLTQNGWKRVDELQIGDDVKSI